MNTHVKAVDRKDTSRHGSDSRDGADKNGLMSRVSMFIVALMLILLSIVSLAANANANTNTATHENSNSSVQKIAKPDNIIDYAEQKIEDFKAEDIDVSKIAGGVLDPLEKNAAQQVGVLQGNSALTGDYNESYYPLTELNTGLPPLTESPNLSTPLATLEFFQSAIMKQQYDLAAYALNMNLMDSELQTSRSIELSRRLDFLLNKKQLYVFDRLPDRPDGLIEPLIGSSSSVRGIPRRSIQLGSIDYRERRVPIFIERVRIGDNAPVWVFSAQTVSNIDNLYEQYQPAPFESYLPLWMTLRFYGIAVWEFLALLTFFTVTMGLGWLLSTGVGKLIRWSASDVDDKNLEQRTVGRKSITDLVNKLTVPLTFSISFSLVYALVSGGFPYLDPVATATRPIIWIGLVLSTIWLGIRIINFFANRYQDLQIENLGEKEFDKYRRRSTYVSIFRRVFIFVMILGSIWNGLSEFTNLEGLGKTLLTSAGIAGAVIGIAAQPILGNIIAGMQVAVTQPIRIGDTVMMEGDWSTVEDLRYTYAVLKTWDERRLFVPMRHFVSEIIENWSHPEAHQTRLVYLYVDYGVKIDKVRQKFIEVVKAHELWDGVVEPGLTATSVTENNIKLLGTLSSDSADNAWILECDVREQMLGYLYDEQKAYLPTERLSFENRSV
ncbi:mechanosensitive ion channel family protein [Psychrobacter frigidicola]|uniref:mechanosensitive ion channel family protein n=1 Tax=Psychrobacter frigidicola TaxID=45611 RepID=UPI001D12DAB4|nr:mechanosensitive ion channel family protein [Psychrobacter frigidicola]